MALVIDPPQPPAAHRLSLTCDRHPAETFTGFCASCLRERLQSLESAYTTSTTHRNSTSTISSSLKSIFFKPSSSAASSSSLLQPELRRCKSFSCGGGRGDGVSGPHLSTSVDPQRKSCDVRGRNTLWSLFNQDDSKKIGNGAHTIAADAAAAAAAATSEIEIDGDEITTVVDPVVETSGEVMEGEKENEAELRPMKDHIDLESQSKKPTFWLAASVFSKKLQKWRSKPKLKKAKKEEEGSKPDAKSPRKFRETQSEVAVDAFGRRSCDLWPRFSLDAGRISFDDPRYSFDEPRASWDGYLIGGRSLHPRLAPMLSVVEDAPTPVVQRSDGQIPVEEDSVIPGGSQQTKDYYSDSSSRSRRRSMDRSNSVRKLSVEMNEAKPVSNAKVSPAGSTEFFRDWSSNSLRDDRSESFESAFRDDSPHNLPPTKKSKRWSKAWSIWGFIHRRSSSRGRDNVVDRSFSETWPELRVNGYVNEYANGRFLRSNSNASSRSSIYGNAVFGSMRKNGLEMNGTGKKKKKKRDEFVLERNRSARYSPGHIDNGMLRFYLTPMRGSRRGSVVSRANSSYQSFTRSLLGLY